MLVFVDDIIVTSDDWKEQLLLSQHLAKEFEMKTLGRLKYFSGIEVSHSKKDIIISQQIYVIDLLKETGVTACKPQVLPWIQTLNWVMKMTMQRWIRRSINV